MQIRREYIDESTREEWGKGEFMMKKNFTFPVNSDSLN